MRNILVYISLLLGIQLYGQKNVAEMLIEKGYGTNTRAIIIANEDYQSYANVYVENEELAINQAERFQQMLIKKLGVLPENIQFYPDAVNTNIKLAVAKLQRTIPANSNLIFYYRGKTYTDNVTGEIYLVPVDVSDDETFYMLGLKDLCTRLNVINRNGTCIFIDALQGTKSGTKCIIDDGFTEGKVPLSLKNMSLYTLKYPKEAAETAQVPASGTKPEIIVTQPAGRKNETTESSVIITGKVISDCKINVISVNGQEAHFTDDGSFFARVTLTIGENIIGVEARNCAGWTRDFVIFNMSPGTPDAQYVSDSVQFAETNVLKESGKNFGVIIGISKYKDPIMPDLSCF